MTTKSIAAPVAEIILTTKKPLLIVLTPRRPEDRWMFDRKGLLSLDPNGIITWHSDDFIFSESSGKSMTDISRGFKFLFHEGWEVLLSEKDPAWHEFITQPCTYLKDSIRIPVHPSSFTLGGRN
jgi:hypothetical protein